MGDDPEKWYLDRLNELSRSGKLDHIRDAESAPSLKLLRYKLSWQASISDDRDRRAACSYGHQK